MRGAVQDMGYFDKLNQYLDLCKCYKIIKFLMVLFVKKELISLLKCSKLQIVDYVK